MIGHIVLGPPQIEQARLRRGRGVEVNVLLLQEIRVDQEHLLPVSHVPIDIGRVSVKQNDKRERRESRVSECVPVCWRQHRATTD
jgi:hypothetical protein